jgi:hypothetical protein
MSPDLPQKLPIHEAQAWRSFTSFSSSAGTPHGPPCSSSPFQNFRTRQGNSLAYAANALAYPDKTLLVRSLAVLRAKHVVIFGLASSETPLVLWHSALVGYPATKTPTP